MRGNSSKKEGRVRFDSIGQLLSRKSQVSFFIIIGILLIAVLGVFVAVKNSVDDPDSITRQETEKDELQLFVEECLYETSEEAIEKIGMGAGYIDPDVSVPVAINDPFNSPALALFEGSQLLPYWVYQESDGLDRSAMPPLETQAEGDDSIQSQLEAEIEEQLGVCLNRFRAFSDKNIEVAELSEPEVLVSFSDDKTIARLDYGLEIRNGNTTSKKDAFFVELPIRLKHIYGLASDITRAEMQTAFIENEVINMIITYSRIDSDYLPPMYGGVQMDSCHKMQFWLAEEVKEQFRDMLTANVPFMQVAGTDTIDFETPQFDDKEHQEIADATMRGFTKRITEKTYPRVRADFNFFEDFPLELDFGKSFLEPSVREIDMIFAQTCFFDYRFYYSTNFPLLITLYDQESYLGNREGFLFQFPLMITIKDNFPRVRYSDAFPSPSSDAEPKYQCEREQRTSGDVSINVIDDRGIPIEEALISYTCGPEVVYSYDENGSVVNASRFSDKCRIGKTGRDGVLNTNLPPCLGGGRLEVYHPENLKVNRIIGSIHEDEEYNFTIMSDRIVERSVSVDKYFVKAPVPTGTAMTDEDPDIVSSDGRTVSCRIDPDGKELKNYESVMLRLRKTDSRNGQLHIQPFVIIAPGGDSKIRLAPGEYTADLMLIRNEAYPGEMTIRKNSQFRKIEGGPFSSDETVRYPEEDVEIPTAITGGASYTFNITPQDLYGSEKINFHVIDEGKPMYVENVGRAAIDREDCSALNRDIMLPEYLI